MGNGKSNMQCGNDDVSSTESLISTSASGSAFVASMYSDPSQYLPTYGMPYPQQHPLSTPIAGHPQPYVPPPPRGQRCYPQPRVDYSGPPVPYWNTQQLQHHQQPMEEVGRGFMIGAFALACVAFVFAGPFGEIACILALVGQRSASAGDIPGAIRLRNASYGVSIAGIVIGIIIIIVLVSVISSTPGTNTHYGCTNYYSYGTTSHSCK